MKKINKYIWKNKKKILIWITICWAIFSFVFLAITIYIDSLSNSWSFTLTEWGGEGDGFNSIAISNDSNYIIASTWEDTILFFKKTLKTPIWQYNEGFRILKVVICHNGSYMVASSQDGLIYLFNRYNSTPMWIYDFGSESRINDIIISSDAKYIAASVNEQNPYTDRIFIFQDLIPVPIWNITGTKMAISENFNYISISDSQYIFLYEMFNSTPLWSYNAGFNSLKEVAIAPTGEYVVASSPIGEISYLLFFNNFSSLPVWSYETTAFGMQTIDISVDGLIVGSGSNGVILFNRSSSNPIWRLNTGLNTVEFSKNGEFILVGSGNKICLFMPSSPNPIWCNSFISPASGGPYPIYGSISGNGKDIMAAFGDKLFSIDPENPFTIETFIPYYINLFSLLGVLSSFLVSLHLINIYKRKKLLKEERVQREDLQKILQHSNRVSKKMVRTVLGIDKSTFEEKISEWAAEFGFKVDGDYVFVPKDDLPEFIKELDKNFEEWQDLKKKKKV